MQTTNLDQRTSINLTEDTIRVSALYAFAYCPRLFYLEEVEELYTQDSAVFAGRRLHEEIDKQEDEEWLDLYLEDEILGLRGRVDALRTRDGQTIPYEHKRGRCYRTHLGSFLTNISQISILSSNLLSKLPTH